MAKDMESFNQEIDIEALMASIRKIGGAHVTKIDISDLLGIDTSTVPEKVAKLVLAAFVEGVTVGQKHSFTNVGQKFLAEHFRIAAERMDLAGAMPTGGRLKFANLPRVLGETDKNDKELAAEAHANKLAEAVAEHKGRYSSPNATSIKRVAAAYEIEPAGLAEALGVLEDYMLEIAK